MELKGEKDIDKALFLLQEIDAFLSFNTSPAPEQMAEMRKTIREFTSHFPDCRKYASSGWVPYDWNKPETRPTKYGKYFVHRKDGKTHWETWNGSGWAYNEKVITFWMEVLPPCG